MTSAALVNQKRLPKMATLTLQGLAIEADLQPSPRNRGKALATLTPERELFIRTRIEPIPDGDLKFRLEPVRVYLLLGSGTR